MSAQVTSESLDHLGIIAGVCQDLDLASIANSYLEKRNVHPKVTVGDAIVALILNGLGFVTRSLYMTSTFFQGKPVEKLLGKGISASDLNDDTLGRALDAIADFGAEKLFSNIAFEIAKKRGLIGKSVHLDTTSLSVEGEFQLPPEDGVIDINYGYSKDHRSDLKQFILSLTVTGKASVPLWVESLSGNTSDKTSFHNTIEKVRKFQEGLAQGQSFLWVADSALYHKEKLLGAQNLRWLTRVPETVKDCKVLVEQDEESLNWTNLENGYKISRHFSDFGGVRQRWVLVFSQKAYEREKSTAEKNLDKTEEQLALDLWHLENQVFKNIEAAQAKFDIIIEKYPLHRIEVNLNEVDKYLGKGRPQKDARREIEGYQVEVATVIFESEKFETLLNRKGRFVIGTNEIDDTEMSDEILLNEYKSQQDVERGFRFIKDPSFGVSDVFLKSPRRIMALTAIMTLCLMVYNIAQFEFRENLAQQGASIPNQLQKQTSSPTLRWIFQLFQDIALVHIGGGNSVVTNITPLREHILGFFPLAVRQMYGRDAPTAHS